MRYSKILLAAIAAAAATNDTACNSLQIFLVRGHGETIPGLQTSISDAICRSQPSSCGVQSIAYNATSDAQTICQDQYDGIQMLRRDLTVYATACPRARLVVSGWSRGGALVTDLFAGGGGGLELTGTCAQPASPALAPDEFPGPRVAAVVTFGELHHNADMPWNVGNGSAADGRYPRTEAMLQNLNIWAERFRDYCVVDDPLCAKGADAAAHSSYFQSAYWPEQVAAFVASKL